MCGRDTLAMEVSSTSMNVAMVTVRAISHGLYFGFQGASRNSVTWFLPAFVGQPLLAVRLCDMRQKPDSQEWLSYLSQTFGTTDIPGRRRSRPCWPGLKRMRTGRRCTTFT